MLLTEEHRIKKDGHKALFRELDDFCFRAKNLHNAVNYLMISVAKIRKILENTQFLNYF